MKFLLGSLSGINELIDIQIFGLMAAPVSLDNYVDILKPLFRCRNASKMAAGSFLRQCPRE